MTTNTIQPTKMDIIMEEIDNLVSTYQDMLSRLTKQECKVTPIQIGNTYIVILRAGRISKTLTFNFTELTEESNS